MKTVEILKDVKDLLRCKANAQRKIERERKLIAEIDAEIQTIVDDTNIRVEGYTKTSVKEMEMLPLGELEKGREI
jgi:hypothetical protein